MLSYSKVYPQKISYVNSFSTFLCDTRLELFVEKTYGLQRPGHSLTLGEHFSIYRLFHQS